MTVSSQESPTEDAATAKPVEGKKSLVKENQKILDTYAAGDGLVGGKRGSNWLGTPAAPETLVSSVPPGFETSASTYLTQLLQDKEKIRDLDHNYFRHVETLIDNEIHAILEGRDSSIHWPNVPVPDPKFWREVSPSVGGGAKPPSYAAAAAANVPPLSPSPPLTPSLLGAQERITVSKRILVPVEEYPHYNFVGRILGPRGMTAKQLEEETQCRIMVRGRGSCRVGSRRSLYGKDLLASPGGKKEDEDETVDVEPLHVLIECEATVDVAEKRLAKAVERIEGLLHPPPEGKDELKRKQLIELSIINGTYRPTTATKNAIQTPRMSPSNLITPMGHLGVGQLGGGGFNNSSVPMDLFKMPQFNMEDMYNQMLLAAAANPSLVNDFYRNYLALQLADPNVLAQLDFMSKMMPPPPPVSSSSVIAPPPPPPPIPQLSRASADSNFGGPIPPANYEEFLTATQMLSGLPAYCKQIETQHPLQRKNGSNNNGR